jgi:hypothetical protein
MAEITPVGGSGGQLRKDTTTGVQKVIVVLISAGMYIDFVQLIVRQEGELRVLPHHGGDGGHLTPFVLADDEYLTGISGWYSWYINSMVLYTNKRVSGRFGSSIGEREYSIQVDPGEQIIGLWTHSEQFIDAIGVITAPAPRF